MGSGGPPAPTTLISRSRSEAAVVRGEATVGWSKPDERSTVALRKPRFDLSGDPNGTIARAQPPDRQTDLLNGGGEGFEGRRDGVLEGDLHDDQAKILRRPFVVSPSTPSLRGCPLLGVSFGRRRVYVSWRLIPRGV